MQLDIPFFSQLDKEVPEQLQRSVCAIACIKMILEFKKEEVDFASVLREAQWIGEMDKAGWTHEVLIRVLRNHKLLAYRQEFLGHEIDTTTFHTALAEHSRHFTEQGIEKIKKNIDLQNPVMVSVIEGFSQNKSDHVVIIAGYTDDSFIIFDPILNEEQNPLVIPIETFKNFWKRLAIFVE
jgi:ABC-type bacteriocin/lantibiotic exporter with double-glycine peptidase domain